MIQWGRRTNQTSTSNTVTILNYASANAYACLVQSNDYDGLSGWSSCECQVISENSFIVNRKDVTCKNWSYFCIGY